MHKLLFWLWSPLYSILFEKPSSWSTRGIGLLSFVLSVKTFARNIFETFQLELTREDQFPKVCVPSPDRVKETGCFRREITYCILLLMHEQFSLSLTWILVAYRGGCKLLINDYFFRATVCRTVTIKQCSGLILKSWNLSHTVRGLLDSYVSVPYVLAPAVLMTAARMNRFQRNRSKRREKNLTTSFTVNDRELGSSGGIMILHRISATSLGLCINYTCKSCVIWA